MTDAATLVRYYRRHASIYDATRWSFLFGRAGLIDRLVARRPPARILEIGCGAGGNLAALARRLPQARLTGIDLSPDMLRRARRRLGGYGERVELQCRLYTAPVARARHDVVLFSYCLSMMNPGWEQAIHFARQELQPGGIIAVADFHDSRFLLFKRWMQLNHVRLDGHLLPHLQTAFQPELQEIQAAYGGWWRYLTFIGAA